MGAAQQRIALLPWACACSRKHVSRARPESSGRSVILSLLSCGPELIVRHIYPALQSAHWPGKTAGIMILSRVNLWCWDHDPSCFRVCWDHTCGGPGDPS